MDSWLIRLLIKLLRNKMKAAIISQGSVSSKLTKEAMERYFDEVTAIDVKELEINISGDDADILYKGEALGKYDCIYAKGSYRFSQALRSLSTILKGYSYMPVEPEAFTVAHDKLLTQLLLQTQGIPMPKTYISTTVDAARKILSNMNYPIILKFPQGTHGKGVLFADSYGSASSILDALTALKQSFLIQEYVDTGSSDIRAFVVGDKVVASMVRKSAVGEQRSNVHMGGHAESINLDKKSQEIAVKAAKATGAEICGVDILPGPKGPLVIETNISPSVQGITKYSGVDVANEIAKHLYERTKSFVSVRKEKHKKEIMEELNNTGNLITNLDFKASRIILPEIATNYSKITSDDQVELKMEKGKISISKLDIN